MVILVKFCKKFDQNYYLCKIFHTIGKKDMNNEACAVLLMHCPDRPGIIAEFTQFVNSNGGNVVYFDQYVDRENGIFYMRVQWELKDFSIPADKIREYFDTLYAQRFQATYHLYFSTRKERMAVFVSRMSHCLYDLLARYTAGEWREWNVEIPVIISNHPDLKFIGEQFDIPFEVVPVTADTKEAAEAEQFRLLDKYKIDFIVLARYMQVLSSDFIERYPNKIINIHHSFLPAFVGGRPYHAAYQRGVKLIGATSHYVTADLDAGPIIEQDITRITHKDTVDDLIKKGRDLEKIVLARAVEKHLQHKILTYANKTVVFN